MDCDQDMLFIAILPVILAVRAALVTDDIDSRTPHARIYDEGDEEEGEEGEDHDDRTSLVTMRFHSPKVGPSTGRCLSGSMCVIGIVASS